MSYESMLNATCTIQRRPVTGTKDAVGADTGEYKYANLATGVPCRCDTIGQTRNRDQTDVVVATHRLFLLKGQDILHTDKVTNVVMGGTTLLAEADVASVDPAPGGMEHHVEAELIRVT